MPSVRPIEHTFLFGSGLSLPAGHRSVSEITDVVLSGKGIMRHTDGNYYFGDPLYAHAGFPDEYVPRIVIFLNRLKVEVDLYYLYQDNRDTNYEDLFYIASQIKDSELGEYDNPAIQPLIDKIFPDVKRLLKGTKSEVRKKWKIHEIASEATNYIRDIVWHSLTNRTADLDYLSFLKDCALDHESTKVDIFTLNHDVLLERFFEKHQINITDGFGNPTNEVRYWSLDLFDTGSNKVRLFKLHGSVDWFKFRDDNSDWSRELIGIPLTSDFWHTKGPNGEAQHPIDGRPMFLAGTFNKILDYTSGIYSDIYYKFCQIMEKKNRLIVCGYGFGDKGINNRIIEWIFAHADRRMLLIHPDPNKLKNSARGAISRNWDQWLNSKKLIILPKCVEQISWQEAKEAFLVD
jgi:hypothetical protein